MRVAALLLLAAVLGFAVGRLTAREERGRGGQRGVAPTTAGASERGEPEPSPAPPAAPREAVSPGGNAVVDGAATATEDDVVLPRPRAEGEWSDLVVDFTGFEGPHTAWVAIRTMTGGIEEEEDEASDGVADFSLYPGTYEVWWFDGEGTKLGVRARVEDGKVTWLRAVDHRRPTPTPKGLGVLEVEVTATWGGVLAEQHVYVRQQEGSRNLDLYTDARGRATAFLAPGRYVVYVVDYESDVVVEESRTTHHRIQHGREGDLVLLADRDALVSIEPVGRDDDYGDADLVGTEALLPYLRTGEYDVVLEDLVSLGRVTIRAGETTRFRCDLPPGGVAVNVSRRGADELGAADVSIRCVANGRKTGRSLQEKKQPTGRIDLILPPGRYVVSASSKECEAPTAEIEVADSVVELTLELRPLR